MRRSPPTHLVHKHREPSPQWSDGMVDPGKLRQQFRARLSRQGKLRGRSMKITGVHRATSNCRSHAVSSRIIFMLRSLRWRTAPPLVTPGTSQAAARGNDAIDYRGAANVLHATSSFRLLPLVTVCQIRRQRTRGVRPGLTLRPPNHSRSRVSVELPQSQGMRECQPLEATLDIEIQQKRSRSGPATKRAGGEVIRKCVHRRLPRRHAGYPVR